MLPWTNLLKSKHFFLTLPNESSGEDFITFRSSSTVNYDKFKDIIREAWNLKSKLESDYQPPIAKLKLVEMLSSAAKNCNVFENIIDEIFLLQDCASEDRPAQMQTIIDLLVALDGPALFYSELGSALSSKRSSRNPGTYHCETYSTFLCPTRYAIQSVLIRI
jgi:hypothetical protein